MIKIKETIIVEGKYDKISLSQVVDTNIIKTDGFAIYKDEKTIKLISKLAETRGVIILTDSDDAGMMIRNYVKKRLGEVNIKHAFVPVIHGKEKRKKIAGKAGIIGVEGIDSNILTDVIVKAGATILGNEKNENNENNEEKELITRLDLYKYGIFGKENSNIKRKKLLDELNLPENMSVTMFIDILNTFYKKSEIIELIEKI